MVSRIAKISTGYKAIVGTLCVLLFVGSSGFGQSLCYDLVNDEPLSHHSEMPDCHTENKDMHRPSADDDHCGSMINCDCSYEVTPVKEFSVLVSKIDLPILYAVVSEIIEIGIPKKSSTAQTKPLINSSPPLFLVNETLLI